VGKRRVANAATQDKCSSTMIIRNAALPDAAEISELTAQLGYTADPAAIRHRLARLLGRQHQLILVASLDDKVVGWMQAHASDVLESGFRVEIVGLIVSQNCRRRGLGRSLIQHAEDWAIELGAETLVVRSNVQRVESRGFYPALGFSTTKTQAVFKKTLQNGPDHDG
jgi:ribosomal protein S18 acetylase RimI-like enzyme